MNSQRKDGQKEERDNLRDQGWWQTTDPEKVSQFLQQWQEWVAREDHEKNFTAWKVFQEQMMTGFQNFWTHSLKEKNEKESTAPGETHEQKEPPTREKASKEEKKSYQEGYSSSPDAVVGFVLYLLQRQDSLEERIRKLESVSARK